MTLDWEPPLLLDGEKDGEEDLLGLIEGEVLLDGELLLDGAEFPT
jgi:hypothetical protein